MELVNKNNSLLIKVCYTNGIMQELSLNNFYRRIHSKSLFDDVAWIEFLYTVPVLNKDIDIIFKQECIRYALGVKIEIVEFEKLLKMNCLRLSLEENFYNKTYDFEYVCITNLMEI